MRTRDRSHEEDHGRDGEGRGNDGGRQAHLSLGLDVEQGSTRPGEHQQERTEQLGEEAPPFEAWVVELVERRVLERDRRPSCLLPAQLPRAALIATSVAAQLASRIDHAVWSASSRRSALCAPGIAEALSKTKVGTAPMPSS